MRVAPFFGTGINQQNSPMGMNFHLLPNTHVLYFGPIECARHTFPNFAEDERASYLIINDVQGSLGKTDDLVRDAVQGIIDSDPSTEVILLCTACQTAFMGTDLDSLCWDLHDEFGILFAHMEANRMLAEHIPGRTRKSVPGGDRYKVRLAFLRTLRQVEPDASASRGVLVLTEDSLDSTCDLLDLAELPGIDWVRGIGDMTSAKEFAECRNACLAIATSVVWKETGEYLRDVLGIPFLFMPTSYSLDEIDSYYTQLEQLFPPTESMLKKREMRCEQALREISSALANKSSRRSSLDLRVIDRPFSLVETLLDYGFEIVDFTPDEGHVNHKEEDDLPAYERLSAKYPDLGERFKARPRSLGHEARGSKKAAIRRRPGRFIEGKKPNGEFHRVPEETAWWGYSSILKLMEYMNFGNRTRQAAETGDSKAFFGSRGETEKPEKEAVEFRGAGAAQKAFWHGMAPFATDTNGACAVFQYAPVLIMIQDSNGSVSTLRRVINVNAHDSQFETIDLPEISFTLGREKDFQERMELLLSNARKERAGRKADFKYVVLMHGPVSTLLGTDLENRAGLFEERCGLPTISVQTSGNSYYDKGISAAYDTIYREFALPGSLGADRIENSVGLLGMTELDYPSMAIADTLGAAAKRAGKKIVTDWGFTDTEARWKQAGLVGQNVVMSASGLKMARRMSDELGIPFETIDQLDWLDEFVNDLQFDVTQNILVIGEQISSNLLRRLLLKCGASQVDVATFFTLDKQCKQAGDLKLKGQDDLRNLLASNVYDFVIGDDAFAGMSSKPYFALMHPPVGFGVRGNQVLSREWVHSLVRARNARVRKTMRAGSVYSAESASKLKKHGQQNDGSGNYSGTLSKADKNRLWIEKPSSDDPFSDFEL